MPDRCCQGSAFDVAKVVVGWVLLPVSTLDRSGGELNFDGSGERLDWLRAAIQP